MDSARLLLRGVFSQEDSPRAGLPPGSGFHSEFFGPMRVGASANLGAFFVKLRLKPLPIALAVASVTDQVPQRLAVSQVPGRDQVDRAVAIHRSYMRLVGLRLGGAPANGEIISCWVRRSL